MDPAGVWSSLSSADLEDELPRNRPPIVRRAEDRLLVVSGTGGTSSSEFVEGVVDVVVPLVFPRDLPRSFSRL